MWLNRTASEHYDKFFLQDGERENFKSRIFATGNVAMAMANILYSIGNKEMSAVWCKSAEKLYRKQYMLNEVAVSRILEVDPSFVPYGAPVKLTGKKILGMTIKIVVAIVILQIVLLLILTNL